MKNILPIAITAFILTGCAGSVPVAVIGQDGRIFKGINTAVMQDGRIEFTDGRTSCTASYNSMSIATSDTVPVKCSDGRFGQLVATRDTADSGKGTIRLNDGYTATYYFGPVANNF
ncbi:hypothetical protein E1162_03765 [Rhodobacteraceae bacterium RKSG542]|uniref:hypothetical protein n=1 Tax=Pseudovibrio flavus TaxID=2529854 RepID=UPI0012BD44E9|nr:hypothetical protein [Pseudovibrio flavus]MTI16355.1 hypothetical protein [Pseudovibrio flavus]